MSTNLKTQSADVKSILIAFIIQALSLLGEKVINRLRKQNL